MRRVRSAALPRAQQRGSIRRRGRLVLRKNDERRARPTSFRCLAEPDCSIVRFGTTATLSVATRRQLSSSPRFSAGPTPDQQEQADVRTGRRAGRSRRAHTTAATCAASEYEGNCARTGLCRARLRGARSFRSWRPQRVDVTLWRTSKSCALCRRSASVLHDARSSRGSNTRRTRDVSGWETARLRAGNDCDARTEILGLRAEHGVVASTMLAVMRAQYHARTAVPQAHRWGQSRKVAIFAPVSSCAHSQRWRPRARGG